MYGGEDLNNKTRYVMKTLPSNLGPKPSAGMETTWGSCPGSRLKEDWEEMTFKEILDDHTGKLSREQQAQGRLGIDDGQGET